MKFEITDQVTYRTVHFTLEDESNNEYIVRITEHDFDDTWEVEDSEGNIVDEDDEIYDELVTICTEQLSK